MVAPSALSASFILSESANIDYPHIYTIYFFILLNFLPYTEAKAIK